MAEQLGRYILHETIGQGGMSEIIRASLQGPMGFAKEVAIKRVPARLTEDADNIHALVNEARIGALVKHHNIVEVYELDQANGSWFVAMELVRGRTLGQLLRRCRATGAFLPRSVTLDIATQAAAGLHHAHAFCDEQGAAVGLVHRDLKPANVMVDDQAVVKVMDFGIARSSLNFYKTSQGGPIKGTPLYMAPEVLRGSEATPASDLFSFGVMLYEALTHCRLFLAPNPAAVMSRLLDMDLDRYLEPIAQVDPPLGRLLARCLSRDPQGRPPSAQQLHDELLAIQQSLGLSPDLAEFVYYLQQAPVQSLVDVDRDAPWAWTDGAGIGGVISSARLRAGRSLEAIAEDLQPFGAAFFGPVLFPDADQREMDSARRSTTPIDRKGPSRRVREPTAVLICSRQRPLPPCSRHA